MEGRRFLLSCILPQRPAADEAGGTKRTHPNPAPLISPRFEHEHEHDAAVATLWRALARCEETPRGWPRRRPCEVGTRTIWLRTSA